MSGNQFCQYCRKLIGKRLHKHLSRNRCKIERSARGDELLKQKVQRSNVVRVQK